jgi:DNA polymerase/3'-5' exonuclease PolX
MSDSPVRWPLRRIKPLAEELRFLLEPACHRIEVGGSARRLRPEIGDIELVCIPKIEMVDVQIQGDLFTERGQQRYHLLWRALDGLLEAPGRKGYLLKGEKARAFWWPVRGDEGEELGHVRIDVYTASPQGWGWIFLARTGSGEFSKSVAGALKARGFRAEGGQIYHVVDDKIHGPAIGTPEEEDVFRLIGRAFVAPAGRSWE